MSGILSLPKSTSLGLLIDDDIEDFNLTKLFFKLKETISSLAHLTQ